VLYVKKVYILLSLEVTYAFTFISHHLLPVFLPILLTA